MLNEILLPTLIVVAVALIYHMHKSNFIIYLANNPDARRGLEAAEGRRTITPDIFPDHNFLIPQTDPNKPCMDWNAEGRQLAKFMSNEAFSEDFVSTRECSGAAQSQVNTNRLFVLPERWDAVVCESHCPDHNMVGTRADTAGNLSADARAVLYDFVPWNVKPDQPDTTLREYVGMQGYSIKEHQA
jgi:hypothetical protein